MTSRCLCCCCCCCACRCRDYRRHRCCCCCCCCCYRGRNRILSGRWARGQMPLQRWERKSGKRRWARMLLDPLHYSGSRLMRRPSKHRERECVRGHHPYRCCDAEWQQALVPFAAVLAGGAPVAAVFVAGGDGGERGPQRESRRERRAKAWDHQRATPFCRLLWMSRRLRGRHRRHDVWFRCSRRLERSRQYCRRRHRRLWRRRHTAQIDFGERRPWSFRFGRRLDGPFAQHVAPQSGRPWRDGEALCRQ